eukprot:4856214-Pyramimonas_sp.AAC.1
MRATWHPPQRGETLGSEPRFWGARGDVLGRAGSAQPWAREDAQVHLERGAPRLHARLVPGGAIALHRARRVRRAAQAGA